MSKNSSSGCEFDIQKEFTRTVLERIQCERAKEQIVIHEPETESPKVKFETEEILNNTYMNRDEIHLPMDIFRPAVSEETELPVIVIIHGGGLVTGDRTMSREYGRALARRGYLVFSVEYRPVPRADTYGQLDDVCAGLDLVWQKLGDYNVDFSRIFLTAESAGAFLAIYIAAMKNSVKLQEAIGHEPARMTFRALGLHGGMYYTDRDDPLGHLLEGQFYGGRVCDKDFRQYLDPEHEEIINNLPPVFMTTGRGDFLNNYTLMYHDALKKAGRRSHLVYYGSDELDHAFVAMKSYLKESIDAIDKMTDWFEEEAKFAQKEQKRLQAEKRKWDRIQKRIDNGKITGQKSWKFIKELNSWSKDRLDKTASESGGKKYTYRQMFRLWERYAEVFSALDITGENNSRAALSGTPSIESSSAFYALNMTGASVSMVHRMDITNFEQLRRTIEKEGITDIIINNVSTEAKAVRELLSKRDELGIRNIILQNIKADGKYVSEEDKKAAPRRLRELKQLEGILYMPDLLDRYEGTEIKYAEGLDDCAVIVHTSGTTSGIHKPIPISDQGLNESVARLLREERFAGLQGIASTCQNMDYSGSYSMIDMLHLPFAFGGKVIHLPYVGFSPLYGMALSKCRPSILFASDMLFNIWSKVPAKFDLSSLEFVFLGGSYVSAEAKKKCDEFLRKNGAHIKSCIGYGLSEAGAACILADPDREDDAIGRPLSGVKVKIFDEDEEKFYDIEDGPRIGVLYLSSVSVSSGRIGDKVFFELTDIDGEKYLNTYDLVRVTSDGNLIYAGRMNKYFVNNEGIRFDSGLIETAISAQEGIRECALAPSYDKLLHDSIPVLYVETTAKDKHQKETAKKALVNAFIDKDLISRTNLPGQLVITDRIPYNETGKVDVHRIMNMDLKGQKYIVIPERKEGKLTGIKLEKYIDMPGMRSGIPEELEKDMLRAGAELRRRQGSSPEPDLHPAGPIGMIFRMFADMMQ